MIERPELIQAHRSHRNDHLLIKAIIGCLIGLTAIIVLANAPHAETVEVGIAPGTEIVSNPYQTIQMTDSEYNELLWVLALEAQTEGQSGIECCCEVVFNRVLSQNNWGGTVHGVLAKRGQFSTYRLIGSKKAWAHPGETEKAAVAAVIANGPTRLPDMRYVYFDTGRKNGKRNIKIGHHWFGAE